MSLKSPRSDRLQYAVLVTHYLSGRDFNCLHLGMLKLQMTQTEKAVSLALMFGSYSLIEAQRKGSLDQTVKS